MVSKETLEEIKYYSEHPWNEKTAKDMFEELGYVERPKNEYYTDAELIYDTQKKFYHSIYFDKDKTIDVSSPTITLDLLKAINKQVEELGWNK